MNREYDTKFRLMTYNIGGGRRDFGSVLSAVIEVVREVSPDILVVQEATDFQDANGAWQRDDLTQIAQAGGFGNNYHFKPTLSMREHIDVRKTLFVDAIFNDWQDWRQGYAIFSHLEFVRLSDPSQPGEPRNVPLYRMPLYQGNRDTEPRYALLARIKKEPIHPFIVGVHFTTLVGERKKAGGPWSLPGKAKEAQDLRVEQAKRLVDLLEKHVLEAEEVVFLLGDFNAEPSEPCISVLENEGFVRLAPPEEPGYTHPRIRKLIDHIFVYPGNRLVDYTCRIINTPTAQEASDHLPVIADVRVI